MSNMRTVTTRVSICDSCAPLLAYGDETGLPDDPEEAARILANVDLLHRPTFIGGVSGVQRVGYSDCWICNETVMDAQVVEAEVAV